MVMAATENTEAASAIRLCALEYAMSSADGGGPATAAMVDLIGDLEINGQSERTTDSITVTNLVK